MSSSPLHKEGTSQHILHLNWAAVPHTFGAHYTYTSILMNIYIYINAYTNMYIIEPRKAPLCIQTKRDKISPPISYFFIRKPWIKYSVKFPRLICFLTQTINHGLRCLIAPEPSPLSTHCEILALFTRTWLTSRGLSVCGNWNNGMQLQWK